MGKVIEVAFGLIGKVMVQMSLKQPPTDGQLAASIEEANARCIAGDQDRVLTRRLSVAITSGSVPTMLSREEAEKRRKTVAGNAKPPAPVDRCAWPADRDSV